MSCVPDGNCNTHDEIDVLSFHGSSILGGLGGFERHDLPQALFELSFGVLVTIVELRLG
jgi:hypothetical protein